VRGLKNKKKMTIKKKDRQKIKEPDSEGFTKTKMNSSDLLKTFAANNNQRRLDIKMAFAFEGEFVARSEARRLSEAACFATYLGREPEAILSLWDKAKDANRKAKIKGEEAESALEAAMANGDVIKLSDIEIHKKRRENNLAMTESVFLNIL